MSLSAKAKPYGLTAREVARRAKITVDMLYRWSKSKPEVVRLLILGIALDELNGKAGD